MVCKFKSGDIVYLQIAGKNGGETCVISNLAKVVFGELTTEENDFIQSRFSEKWKWESLNFGAPRTIDDGETAVFWINTLVYCDLVGKTVTEDDCINPLFAGKRGMVLSEGIWNVEPPIPWYYVTIDGWGICVDEPHLALADIGAKMDYIRRPIIDYLTNPNIPKRPEDKRVERFDGIIERV